MIRKRKQMFFFFFEHSANSSLAALHPVIAIGQTVSGNLLVKLLDALCSWDRNQVVSPNISDVSFNASLLVGACNIAEPGIKAVVAVKPTEAFLFNPSFTTKHFADSRGEIVIVMCPSRICGHGSSDLVAIRR